MNKDVYLKEMAMREYVAQQQMEVMKHCDELDYLDIKCSCGGQSFVTLESIKYIPVINPKNTTKHPLTQQPFPILVPIKFKVCADCRKVMDYTAYVNGKQEESEVIEKVTKDIIMGKN